MNCDSLGLFTPHDVHYGLAEAKREQRARVLAEAFAKNPARFPNGRPTPSPAACGGIFYYS